MFSLDIDLLRAFVAVANTGGFTSAAKQLHRTQSAISMQIRRIEEMVGKPVFDRSTRSVNLTQDGEILIGHARQILKINDEAYADLVTPEIEGIVRIGIPDSYGTYLLPRILASFVRTYPKVQLEVSSGITEPMLKSLENGNIDLALIGSNKEPKGGTSLWIEPIVWVAAKDFSVAEKGALPLILYPQGCVIRNAAIDTLESINRHWRIAYCSPNLAAIQAAVIAGLGVGVLASGTVMPEMRILGSEDKFPNLPPSYIELHRTQHNWSRAVDQLARHIESNYRGNVCMQNNSQFAVSGGLYHWRL